MPQSYFDHFKERHVFQTFRVQARSFFASRAFYFFTTLFKRKIFPKKLNEPRN